MIRSPEGQSPGEIKGSAADLESGQVSIVQHLGHLGHRRCHSTRSMAANERLNRVECGSTCETSEMPTGWRFFDAAG
jgi:hypothetical protein